MSSDAYLAHLLGRMNADLDFLRSHGLISQVDHDLVKAKLPTVNGGAGLQNQFNGLNLGTARDGVTGVGQQQYQQQQPPQQHAPPPPAPTPAAVVRTCRATWDYSATQPDDLGFNKGDIITLEEELNVDWWRGTLHGRTGLFPSNYVEKLDPTPSHASSPAPPPPPAAIPSYEASVYSQPTGSSSNTSYGYVPPPPPSHASLTYQQPYAYQQPQSYASTAPHQPQSNYSYNPNQGEKQSYAPPAPSPAPATEPAPANGAPPVPKKKFGKVGGQLGQAFVGGLGFGAGTAVAGNAINAIF